MEPWLRGRWENDRPILVAPEFDPDVTHTFQRRSDQELDPWDRWNFWGSVSSWHPAKRTLNGVHVGAILVRAMVPAADVAYWESNHGRGQVKGFSSGRSMPG